MLKLTITIEGKTANDLSLALEAVTTSVENGNIMGMDSNDSGSYGFEISGDDESVFTQLDNQTTKSLNLFKPTLTQTQHDRVLQWATALASGEYKHGLYLYNPDDNSYDAFGVANKIFDFKVPSHHDYLTSECAEALGLMTQWGNLDNPDGEEIDLTSVSDEIMNFRELAQLLRDQLEFSEIVG